MRMRARAALVGLFLVLAACGDAGVAATKPATTAPFPSSSTTAPTTTVVDVVPTVLDTTVSTLAGMPDEAAFRDARAAGELVDGETFLIDPGDCVAAQWFVYLGLGSAYAVTAPTTDGGCEVWLGGELENPNYTGLPATFCRFESDDAIVMLIPGDGGPVSVDDPACAPTGFEQGSPVD